MYCIIENYCKVTVNFLSVLFLLIFSFSAFCLFKFSFIRNWRTTESPRHELSKILAFKVPVVVGQPFSSVEVESYAEISGCPIEVMTVPLCGFKNQKTKNSNGFFGKFYGWIDCIFYLIILHFILTFLLIFKLLENKSLPRKLFFSKVDFRFLTKY